MGVIMAARPPPGDEDSTTQFMRILYLSTGEYSDGYPEARMSAEPISSTIFAQLDQPPEGMIFLTCHREANPVIEGGRIYHSYSFKVFTNRALSNFIGWLELYLYSESEGTYSFRIRPVPIIWRFYSDEPATYPGLPLLVSVNYRIDLPVYTTACSVAYGSDDEDVPLFELIDDLLNTDLEDRYSDDDTIFGFLEDSDEEDQPTTNWCRSYTNYIPDSFLFFFIPIVWYNSGSCSVADAATSEIGLNSFYPASAYYMQCFTNNHDIFGSSNICESVRQYTAYSTQDACILYSSMGRFFYGPNRTSPSPCGAIVSDYPALMAYTEVDGEIQQATMVANSTVGTCLQGSCQVDNQQFYCEYRELNPDRVEDVLTPSEEVEQQWWRTRSGIIAIAAIAIVLLVTILIISVILSQFVFKKNKSTKRVVIRRQVRTNQNTTQQVVEQEYIEEMTPDEDDEVQTNREVVELNPELAEGNESIVFDQEINYPIIDKNQAPEPLVEII